MKCAVVARRQDMPYIVMVELHMQSAVECSDSSSVCLGSVIVSKSTQWMELEETIAVIFLNHISEVSLGLQTQKTCHPDEGFSDAANPSSLGISLSSIKYYSIGDYTADAFYCFFFAMLCCYQFLEK